MSGAHLSLIDAFPVEGGTLDEIMDNRVRAERGDPFEIFERWRAARRASVAALRDADPDARYPWAAAPLHPQVMATTRLAEHWAHALDIAEPLGAPYPDTDRLRHIAWLGHRTLPYGFGLVGEQPQPVYVELTAPARTSSRGDLDVPSGTWACGAPDVPSDTGTRGDLDVPSDTWTYGDPDAPSRITGRAGAFCRVGAQRLAPTDSGLVAEGPYGAAALEVLRNYAA